MSSTSGANLATALVDGRTFATGMFSANTKTLTTSGSAADSFTWSSPVIVAENGTAAEGIVIASAYLLGEHAAAADGLRVGKTLFLPNSAAGSDTFSHTESTPASQPWYFPDTSFWRQDISTAPLHANSSQIAAQIVAQIGRNYGTVVLNSRQYTPRIFSATAGNPRIAFTFNDCQSKGFFDSGLRSQFSNVPIPPGFGPAPGTDAEAVIYNSTTHELWEMWELLGTGGGGWSLCWGGAISNTTASDGIFPGGYGATATGLPFIGGLITRAEYLAGSIDHAIGIAWTENVSGHCWPAQRDDGGYGTDTYRPKEGQRHRWPAGMAMPGGLSNLEQQIFRAGKKYGFVVWDKSGGATVRAELSSTWEDAEPDIWDLTSLPWGSLQTIQEGWGAP